MKALIIIDLQMQFFDGGAYPLPNSDRVLKPINRLLKKFNIVVFTKNPLFQKEGSPNDDLHPGIEWKSIREKVYIYRKKYSSAFCDTGLAEFFDSKNVEEVYICGLSLDPKSGNTSVRDTAVEAAEMGFITRIILDGTDIELMNRKNITKELSGYDIKVIDSWELPLFNLL